MSIFDTVLKAMAGLYQATPTEVADGETGQIRMSERRALITSADWASLPAFVSEQREYFTSTSEFRFYLPIEFLMADKRAMSVINYLGVPVSFSVKLWPMSHYGYGEAVMAYTLQHGNRFYFLPSGNGTNGSTNIKTEPWLNDVLMGGFYGGYVSVTPASVPSSGFGFQVGIFWRN